MSDTTLDLSGWTCPAPLRDQSVVVMGHGGGGVLSAELVRHLFAPAYGNEVVSMLKSTSLASTITVMELTGAANTIVARTFAPYELFITAALIYLAITYVLTTALRALEHRLSRHMRPLDSSAVPLAGEANHAGA